MRRIAGQENIKVQRKGNNFEVPVPEINLKQQDFGVNTLIARLEHFKLNGNITGIEDINSFVGILRQSKFQDGSRLFATQDMWKEVLDLILTQGIEFTLNYIANAKDYDDYIFNQPCMDIGKHRVNQEVNNILFERKGQTGLGTCPNCGCKELKMVSKQLRSADEGETSIRMCVNCEFELR